MNNSPAREIKFFFFIFSTLVFLTSCRQRNDVGLPGAETINAIQTDSFQLLTYTVSEDSIRTDELRTFALGSINNDPVFGESAASLFTHFLLPTDNLSFGNTSKLDSVVLTLAYTGNFYGDSTSSQTLTIKEVSDELAYNTDYYAHSQINTSTLVGFWQGNFNMRDSVYISKTKKNAPPHLRIRLLDDFGKRIMANGKTWLDNPDFLATFKGLAILSSNAGGIGCQAYFDPNSTFTAVKVYYNDSMEQSFSLYSNGARAAARISQYNHIYTQQQQGIIKSRYNHDTCYIQAQAGRKLKLELPTLYNLVKDNPDAAIVVHGAELTISGLDGGSSHFPNPEKLLLVKCDSLGRNTPIKDIFLTSFSNAYLGGSLNKSSNNYKFNFLNEMQDIFSDMVRGKKTNYGYYVLIPGDNPMTASRLLVDTRKNPKQIKFKLTYSVVK